MFGRRPTASSTCDPTIVGAPFGAVDADRDAVLVRRDGDALGAGADLNAFAHENVLDRLRHICVFATDQTRRLLDDGHCRAEPPMHLRELEADVAAAHDHQVLRRPVQRQDRGVGEIGHLADAGKSGTMARPPTLMKMRGAVSSSSPTRTVSGASKRA